MGGGLCGWAAGGGRLMKQLFLIGGPMGVGKTTVCQHLKTLLPRSVFLDGDWCWDAHPFQVTEETKAMVTDNICHLLNNFLACSAYENIVFCWVMHQQEIIDGILSRLNSDACRVHCLSLTAEADCLRQRLEEDVRRGLRTEDVIPRSLERLPLYPRLDTQQVDTTGKTARQVAEEIIALCAPN